MCCCDVSRKVALASRSAVASRSSISIFHLQRQVANALSEGEGSAEASSASEYVGLPGLAGLFSSQPWGGPGEPFRLLHTCLQCLGIFCWTPAFVRRSAGSFNARARHLLSLGYVVLWHTLLWAGLLRLVAAAFAPQSPGTALAPPSFFQAVQGLLLLAAIAAHVLCMLFFGGSTVPVLVDVAKRWSFILSWERSVHRTALALAGLALLLGTSVLLARGEWLHMGKGRAAEATAAGTACLMAALGWAFLLTVYLLLSMVIDFCSLGLDAFALELLNAPGQAGLSGLVGQFNVLNATIRRAAYASQSALTLFVTLTMALSIASLVRNALPAVPVLPGGSEGSRSSSSSQGVWSAAPAARGSSMGDVVAVAWAAALLVLGLNLLSHIAVVNLKCKRLPALVHSLDFGLEIDHDRWCVAAHIAGSEAGFPVHSVLVSRGAVFKLGYISLASVCLLATRLVVSHGA